MRDIACASHEKQRWLAFWYYSTDLFNHLHGLKASGVFFFSQQLVGDKIAYDEKAASAGEAMLVEESCSLSSSQPALPDQTPLTIYELDQARDPCKA